MYIRRTPWENTTIGGVDGESSVPLRRTPPSAALGAFFRNGAQRWADQAVSTMKVRSRRHVNRKRSVTIRIDEDTLTYFAELSDETTVPYQTLINHYLGYCVDEDLILDVSSCRKRRDPEA
jgi:predicted DNA binding CopG/RHH family protein